MKSLLKDKQFIVITSINPINDALLNFSSKKDWSLILVGDRKGPEKIENENILFLNIHQQNNLDLIYPSVCPENHYCRKNIGYLYAMKMGATIIGESDDDNYPYDNWGSNISFESQDLDLIVGTEFFNAYSEFSDIVIWPRGYPLEKILNKNNSSIINKTVNIGVIQQLADNNPDVDAIYRLTINKMIQFLDRKMFALNKLVYCPFNSQNTFWSKEGFPFMYLPQTVTFRFTDILRGYIAQRLLWEDNLHLCFGGPTVYQQRNSHDLMQDFYDEIPMYSNVSHLTHLLNNIKLSGSPLENLYQIYNMLIENKIVAESEIIGVKHWIMDLKNLGFK